MAIQFTNGFTVTSISAAVSNGSVLFNTSPSQYLSIPNNVAFVQTGGFTIESDLECF